MTTQILAVDDSVTMRKILEITFSGSGFQLHVVATPEEAHNRLREGGIAAVLCDGSLEPSGYDVAQQLKSIAPSVPILLLASRQNPYDAARGQAAGVEDNIVKPFDTAQLLERVTKLVSGAGAVPSLATTTPAPAPTPSLMAAAGAPVTANTVAATPKPAAAVSSATATASAAKGRTMLGQGPASGALPAQKPAGFGSSASRPAVSAAAPMPRSSVAPAPPPSRPGSTASAPAVAVPAAAAVPAVAVPAAAVPAAAVPAAAVPAAAVGQALASAGAKIEGLGLTPAQADAVLALSRELVEKIVWEVVPVLAEALIKEEIARLTK